MNGASTVIARKTWLSGRVAMEAGRCQSTLGNAKPHFLLPLLMPIGLMPIGLMPIGLMPIGAGIFRWLGLAERGKRNARDIRLTRVEHRFADLPPAFDGFTILHLSDFHPRSLDGVMEAAVRILDGIEVDVAVLTGDYQTHGKHSAQETAAAMVPVLAAFTAKEGTLAVLGNHDTHFMVDALEDVGVRVLLNEHVQLTRGGQQIHVTGLDDVHWFYSRSAMEALHAGPLGFRIALVHSPEAADYAAKSGVNLYLCGHTHGGQICLPGGWPIFSATRGHRDKVVGAWRKESLRGYTSRGIGVGTPPFRFFSCGEVVIHVLRRAEAPSI